METISAELGTSQGVRSKVINKLAVPVEISSRGLNDKHIYIYIYMVLGCTMLDKDGDRIA